MLQTINAVANTQSKQYYKNTGMTAEELVDFALGVKKKGPSEDDTKISEN